MASAVDRRAVSDNPPGRNRTRIQLRNVQPVRAGALLLPVCDTLLFDSSEKFESHSGWPSFTQPIKANVIAYHFDGPAFLKRVEAVCNTCEAHLGHVFPDGPEPSGLRYCMNAVALTKVEKI